MTTTEPCIYCASTVERRGREHVVPQALGRFEQNWTLLTEVCDSCNQFFGRELDLHLTRDSFEAYLRLSTGLKPARGATDLRNRRMKATLKSEDSFNGTRVRLAPTINGDDVVPVPEPQVGFRRHPGGDWVFLPEREWSEESLAAARGASQNVEVQLVADAGQLDCMRDKLAGFGVAVTETERRHDVALGGRVQVQFDFRVDTTIFRAAGKIAFNYAAKVLGGAVIRRSDFDEIRAFIRHGVELQPLVTAQRLSILVGPDATASQTHAVGIGWHAEKRCLVGIVSLFNTITYGVRLCRSRRPALAMPANKKKDPRYAEIYRDMPGYSGMRPRRLRPMIVGVPPRVGAAYAGIGRRNCGSRLLIHQMAFKPRFPGVLGSLK